jgi:hypothetical protein
MKCHSIHPHDLCFTFKISSKNQRKRELSAFFTYSYLNAIEGIRKVDFKPSDRGVPLEYFEWERVVVDEIHECLMAEKDFLELDWFKEKNRRASRELLGIAQKSVSKRYVTEYSLCFVSYIQFSDNSVSR